MSVRRPTRAAHAGTQAVERSRAWAVVVKPSRRTLARRADGDARGRRLVATSWWHDARPALSRRVLPPDFAAHVPPPPRRGFGGRHARKSTSCWPCSGRTPAQVAAARADRKTEVERFYGALGIDSKHRPNCQQLRSARGTCRGRRPHLRTRGEGPLPAPASLRNRTATRTLHRRCARRPFLPQRTRRLSAMPWPICCPCWCPNARRRWRRGPMNSRGSAWCAACISASDLEAGRLAARRLLSEMNAVPGFRDDAALAGQELRAALGLPPLKIAHCWQRFRPLQREPRAAEAGAGGGDHTAPVQRGNSRHDCEPETEAAGLAIAAGVEPREGVEHRGTMGFGNSLAVVFDDQAAKPVLARHFDADVLARVTQRIREQVAQRQLHEPRFHPQRSRDHRAAQSSRCARAAGRWRAPARATARRRRTGSPCAGPGDRAARNRACRRSGRRSAARHCSPRATAGAGVRRLRLRARRRRTARAPAACASRATAPRSFPSGSG